MKKIKADSILKFFLSKPIPVLNISQEVNENILK